MYHVSIPVAFGEIRNDDIQEELVVFGEIRNDGIGFNEEELLSVEGTSDIALHGELDACGMIITTCGLHIVCDVCCQSDAILDN